MGGAHTAPSNAAFDADLKRRNPSSGVRDIDDVVREAAPHGLELREVIEMPANNLSLVFVKTAGQGRALHQCRTAPDSDAAFCQLASITGPRALI
jgi:Protein of unknown function (DUF938)